MPSVRPLTPGDADAANRAAAIALDRPGSIEPGPARDFHLERVRHLAATDPGGAWVSLGGDGEITGLALALLRDGLWGLSLLAVDPTAHGTGAGRALVEAAFAHGAGATDHLILASQHPAALRLYAGLGLAFHPAAGAAGIADLSRAPALAAHAEEGPPEATREISRHVRAASHDGDLPVSLRHGDRLLLVEDRAFALASPRTGSVQLVAGRDEEAAAAALWAALIALGPGATANVDFLTSAQGWAVQVCLDARLAFTVGGAVFHRGPARMAPYLPSGAWL